MYDYPALFITVIFCGTKAKCHRFMQSICCDDEPDKIKNLQTSHQRSFITERVRFTVKKSFKMTVTAVLSSDYFVKLSNSLIIRKIKTIW